VSRSPSIDPNGTTRGGSSELAGERETGVREGASGGETCPIELVSRGGRRKGVRKSEVNERGGIAWATTT
jgi:hypothetical protein